MHFVLRTSLKLMGLWRTAFEKLLRVRLVFYFSLDFHSIGGVTQCGAFAFLEIFPTAFFIRMAISRLTSVDLVTIFLNSKYLLVQIHAFKKRSCCSGTSGGRENCVWVIYGVCTFSGRKVDWGLLGFGLRIIDFRRLNFHTRFDAFPLTRIDDALDLLGGAQVLSTLDQTSAFWSIELHPEEAGMQAIAGLFSGTAGGGGIRTNSTK